MQSASQLYVVGGHVDWIHLAQNRGQWQDLVNTIINLLVL
jgi:hypothetical protein